MAGNGARTGYGIAVLFMVPLLLGALGYGFFQFVLIPILLCPSQPGAIGAVCYGQPVPLTILESLLVAGVPLLAFAVLLRMDIAHQGSRSGRQVGGRRR